MLRHKIAATSAMILLIISLAILFQLTQHWIRAADVVDKEFAAGGGISRGAGAPAALYMESDSYYWLAYAQDVLAGKDWRSHYTMRDNPPFGRPVHWAVLYIGLLIFAGKITAGVTGLPIQQAIEAGSCWINPALLAILIIAGFVLVWRRFGAWAAGILALSLATLGDVGWTFQALRPDHQGLHGFFAFFTVLMLVSGGLGWVRRGTDLPDSELVLAQVSLRKAQWFFISSAIAGGLGLWVSAFVQSMVIVAVFFSVVGLAILCPRQPGDEKYHEAGLWRLWGWVGAGTSFLCYLLEYFPHEMHLRLEVNHPLYSAAWLAIGEMLYQISRWTCGKYKWRGMNAVITGLCGAVVLLLPILILFGPPEYHALRDGYMSRLHNFIGEFYSYPAFSKGHMWKIFFTSDGVIALSLVLALYLAADRRIAPSDWSALWFIFAMTFFFLLVAYLQVRWLSIYSVLQCLLAAVCVGLALQKPSWKSPRKCVGAAFAVILGVQGAWLYRGQENDLQLVFSKENLPQQLGDPAMQKQLALQLAKRRGDKPWRFLSDPNYAPALQYFAGIPSVTSFYWENMGGLHDAADFLSDDGSGDQALRIARERKLTHVLLPVGNIPSNLFYFIRHGEFSLPRSADTLAGLLNEHWFRLPPWIQIDPELQLPARQVFRYTDTPIEQSVNIFKIDTNSAQP